MRKEVTKHGGSVRIGPLSLLVFIVIICIAIMAMLSLATARANATFTDRQDRFTQDVYQNERAAQLFVSEMDKTLSQGGENSLREQLPALTTTVQSVENSQVNATLSDDGTLDVTFETDNGRKLVVQIATTNNGYTITKWNTDIDWKEDDTVRLWQG